MKLEIKNYVILFFAIGSLFFASAYACFAASDQPPLQGAVDKVEWNSGNKKLHIAGWVVATHSESQPEGFEVHIDGTSYHTKKWEAIPRPDVDKHLGRTSTKPLGWNFSITLNENNYNGEKKPVNVEILAIYENKALVFTSLQKVKYLEEPNYILKWVVIFSCIGLSIFCIKRSIIYCIEHKIISKGNNLSYKPRWGVWIGLLAIGLAISTLISPFQSPDEHSHIFRAYSISQGDFIMVTPPNSSSGGFVDKNLLRYTEPYWDIKSPISRTVVPDTELRWSNEKNFSDIAVGTGYYLPVIYFPHALGLKIGDVLEWTIGNTYRLTRFLVLLSALALIWVAVRIHTPPPLALVLVLLPMTVFQLLSPTIDGLSAALTLLSGSLLFALLGGRFETQSEAASWWLTVCIVILASCRIHALPLLGVLFYLAWWQKGSKAWMRAVLASIIVVGWVLFAMNNTKDTRVVLHIPTSSLLVYYATQPWEFFRVIANTLNTSWILDHYIHSFIGVLGWLNLPLNKPQHHYILMFGLLVSALVSLVCLRDTKYPWLKLGLIGIAICSILMVFLALLITWTPHPADTIQGVQGRYFLLPTMILAYALDDPSRSPMLTRWQWRIVSSFGLCSLTILFVTVLVGYQ